MFVLSRNFAPIPPPYNLAHLYLVLEQVLFLLMEFNIAWIYTKTAELIMMNSFVCLCSLIETDRSRFVRCIIMAGRISTHDEH